MATNRAMSIWGVVLSCIGAGFGIAVLAAVIVAPVQGTGGPGYFGG